MRSTQASKMAVHLEILGRRAAAAFLALQLPERAEWLQALEQQLRDGCSVDMLLHTGQLKKDSAPQQGG